MEQGTGQRRTATDTGPFALVPEWVLDAEISDRAVRLYAVLGRYADTEGRSWPSRRKLALRLSCSTDSLDRARAELTGIGALRTIHRQTADGDQDTNVYLLRRGIPTDAETGMGTDAETGMGRDRDQNENQVEREPEERERPGGALSVAPLPGPRTVNRRTVTNTELDFAWAILSKWNQAAGQDLRSHDWITKIIMRIREYPDAMLADHALIIRTALANPWWKGPPSPSVVYGNGAQFERSIQQVRVSLGETESERLARIVTAAADTARRTA